MGRILRIEQPILGKRSRIFNLKACAGKRKRVRDIICFLKGGQFQKISQRSLFSPDFFVAEVVGSATVNHFVHLFDNSLPLTESSLRVFMDAFEADAQRYPSDRKFLIIVSGGDLPAATARFVDRTPDLIHYTFYELEALLDTNLSISNDVVAR